MAQLATCPCCTTQLALPDGATLSDRARCPRCASEFLLMETVQFSIPTAEILPPSAPEPQDFGAPAVAQDIPVAPMSHEIARERLQETLVQEFPRDTSGSETANDMTGASVTPEFFSEPFAREDASEAAEPTQTYEPEPLPAAPTLSDWEARLKRAMAEDVDEVTQMGTAYPNYESRESPLFQAAESAPPATELNDFAVPETDLVPEIAPEPVAQGVDDWSPDEYTPADYIDDQDLTVKSTGDQTLSDYTREPEEETDAIIADRGPRKKRKRSMVRTLASASLGVIGIPIGLYILLWLKGPAGDIAGIAQYLPSFMKPASFAETDPLAATQPEQIVEETPLPAVEETTALIENEAESEPTDEETTPEVLEDPEVAPASAEVPMYHGPIFAPVDGSEFAELLTAARNAASQLGEGDLKSKESVARKGQAYMALASLADKSSFLNKPEPTPEETTEILLAKQLFESTLGEEGVQRDLPQIAFRWWQYAQRPSAGMILTGRIERLQPSEAGTVAFVSLDTEPVAPEIPVLIGSAQHREGEVIGIVGSIMANPQEELAEVGLAPEPILIAHYSFPLEPAAGGQSESQLPEQTQ